MSIKIFHTADVHLGAKFSSFGKRADLQRKEIEKSFTKIVDLALEKEVHIFMIAGDLFDSPFPSLGTTAFVINQLKRLIQNRIYIALIAGNHDYLCANSIYYSDSFKGLSDKYLKIFNSKALELWNLDELNTQIIGISLDHPKNSVSINKENIENQLNSEIFRVGIFHGSIDIGSLNKYNLLDIKKIESLDCDYVALGDWHNQLKIPAKKPTYYSGSPELIATDQINSGSILEITIDEKELATIKSVQISNKKFKQLKIDLSRFNGFLSLYEFVKKLADKDLLLELVIEGQKTLSSGFDLNKLRESLSEDFFLLKVKDESILKMTEEDLQKYSEKLVIGRYIKILKEEGQKQSLPNGLLDQALQLGVNLLSGEDK